MSIVLSIIAIVLFKKRKSIFKKMQKHPANDDIAVAEPDNTVPTVTQP